MIEIVAHSETMREAVRLADRVAATDANVLVTGESGVGKDAIAFYIHSKSKRAAQSFVKIDCATLPSGLLEAELLVMNAALLPAPVKKNPAGSKRHIGALWFSMRLPI